MTTATTETTIVAADRVRSATRKRLILLLVGIAFVALFTLAPYIDFASWVLPGDVSSPGTLETLALILTIASLAVTFDLLMGYTGLLSLGHALFFAFGGYGFAMMLTLTDVGFTASVLSAIGVTLVAAIILNSVALRATHIAFSMVTLAFAQLAATLIGRNYLHTGGDNGIPLPGERMPWFYVGIINTRYLYWTALGLLAVVLSVALWLTSTRVGRVWQAIRENELRVSVMGLNPYLYKLSAAVAGSTLAGLCGVVYTIVIGTADPGVTGLFYSLGLVVMVIIGGRGRVWGAALGGAVYTLLQQRLPTAASSGWIAGLPKAVRLPLQGPQILLGAIFILFIFLAPGGLADLILRIPRLFKSRSVNAPTGGSAVGDSVPTPQSVKTPPARRRRRADQ